MLVSGCILIPSLGQAQTLEESVAQTLATHPKIKEAFDLYQARLYQHDGAKGGYYPTIDLRGGVGYEKTDSPSTRAASANSNIDDSMTRKEAGLSLRQMLFDGFDVSNNVSRTEAEANAQRLAMISEAENTALRVAEVYLNMLRQQRSWNSPNRTWKPTNRSAATSASGLIQDLALLRIRPRLKGVLPGPIQIRPLLKTTIATQRVNLFVS